MRSSLTRVLLLPLAALLASAACESPAGAPQEESGEPDITWLRQAAVTLHSVDPGSEYDDINALGSMVGNARIVGLGEATHGTHEFFRMKHRMLQYLVEEQGFSTFGIEATFPEATRLNRYVLTGEGNPRALLTNLYFWTWNTQEVLDMIEWMRAYNADPAHTRKLTFWGFDTVYSRVAMNDVEAYLRRVDPAAADSADAWYACYRIFEDSIYKPLPNYQIIGDAVKAECRRGVVAVDSLMEARAAEFSAVTGRGEYDVARQTARIVVQSEDARSQHPSAKMRDFYMARTIEWIAETGAPGTRLVVWAHNLHVGRSPAWGMGDHLTQRFGDAYRIVGFSFYSGTVHAVLPGSGLRPIETPVAAPNSYEHQFHRLGVNGFIVDLRPVRAGSVPESARWLRGPLPFRQIGAIYAQQLDTDFYISTPLADEYDILVHVDLTHASAVLASQWN
jgi:erythromycin esterase